MGEVEFVPQDIFDIKGRGIVVTGSLLQGTLVKGMKVNISGKLVEIAGIETFRKSWDTIAHTDDKAKNIGILLKGIYKEDIEPFIKNHQTLFLGG